MNNSSRRNIFWLAALGILIALGVIVGDAPIALEAILIAVFAVAVGGSLFNWMPNTERIIQSIQQSPIKKQITPQASEASERAKSRGGFADPDMILLDTGVIAIQTGGDGINMRRSRRVSKDDDSVRPFITLYATPITADRNVLIRFEIYNQYGEQQYVHEMTKYLRDGENHVIPDHHLKMSGNQSIEGTGDWDLRVYVDSNLVAMHNFSLMPSDEDRLQRLGTGKTDMSNSFTIVDDTEESIPLTLEALLNDQEVSGTKQRQTVHSSHRRGSG